MDKLKKHLTMNQWNLSLAKRTAVAAGVVIAAVSLSACAGVKQTAQAKMETLHTNMVGNVGTAELTESVAKNKNVDNGRACINYLANAPLSHFGNDWSLPEGFVDLRSEEGQKRLTECTHCDDYPALSTAYLTQATQTFCGLASTTMVLNADSESRNWRPVTQPYVPFHFYTQCNLLNGEVKEHIKVSKVLKEGMELNEIFFVVENQPSVEKAYCQHATSARAEGYNPTSDAPHNCGVDETYEDFMKTITAALDTPRHYVIANFAGAPSPTRGGHFSPIAAYHEESDSFLIMDVARYKYPPFWIRTKALWEGMQKIDSGSGRARGYIIAKTRSATLEAAGL